jgi:hypothetical protein
LGGETTISASFSPFLGVLKPFLGVFEPFLGVFEPFWGVFGRFLRDFGLKNGLKLGWIILLVKVTCIFKTKIDIL